MPHITKNLISVSQFAKDNRVFFEFHPNFCAVKSQVTNEVLLQGNVVPNGLYSFSNIKLQHPVSASTLVCISTVEQSSVPSCNKSEKFNNVEIKTQANFNWELAKSMGVTCQS